MAETKLFFLGTAASDFSPRLETDCKNRFDKNARRASCMMIDGHILVDCDMYFTESMRISGFDMSKITDVFITHLHNDHYVWENLVSIASASKTPVKIWVRRDAKIPEVPNAEIINMREMTEYEFEPGSTVEAVDANHPNDCCPQHFIFNFNGKKMMYATDGAWILNSTYNHIKNAGLSMLIIDGTMGDYIGDYRVSEHNSIAMLKVLLPSLKSIKAISDATDVYLTHIAPSLHKPHDEIVEEVAPYGMKVAYDGLKLTL